MWNSVIIPLGLLLAVGAHRCCGASNASTDDNTNVWFTIANHTSEQNNSSKRNFLLELSVGQLRQMHAGTTAVVNFNLTATEPHEIDHVSLQIKVLEDEVATSKGSDIILDWLYDDRSLGKLVQFAGLETVDNGTDTLSSSGSFSIDAAGLGHTKAMLSVTYYNISAGMYQTSLVRTMPISVIRAPRWSDFVFRILVYILVAVSGTVSSLKLDLQVIKETFKKPKAPIIGFFSQYITMPLIAYGIIMLRGYTGGAALGLFAMGCGPGGGQSNMYTFLLDGDVSVSVTMTLVSTFASLGMMPLWMYTLGTTLPGNEAIDRKSIKVPFVNILTTVAAIITPAAVGLLIKWKFPVFSRKVVKLVNIPLLIMMFAFIAFATYTNWFMFAFFDAETLFSCALLPYGGFILGGLIALAARFDIALIKTIAIETGINNVGVAIVLVQGALPQPDADLAMVPVLASQVMMPIPLLGMVICYRLYKRCCKKKDAGTAEKVDIERKIGGGDHERLEEGIRLMPNADVPHETGARPA